MGEKTPEIPPPPPMQIEPLQEAPTIKRSRSEQLHEEPDNADVTPHSQPQPENQSKQATPSPDMPEEPEGEASLRKPATREARRNILVMVVPELLDRLDAYCEVVGRSRTEAVLTAHINHAEAVAAKLAPRPDDKERIQMGLPPEAISQPLPPGHPMSMRVTLTAHETISSAAQSSGVSLRLWVHELLEALLADK